MAKEYSRTQRIAEQMQRDLAQLIQREVKDPRLGMVTISFVKVARDLGYAEVYFTVMPFGDQKEEEAVKAAAEVLKDAAGFLRTELARNMQLRTVPKLRFHYDASIDRGRRLHSLIEKTVRDSKAKDNSQADNDSE
ncbi:ribosome-binding factor A ['Osedax' symbiont bacterium Rs2_46_30_T18]|nr:ribosome-binding factor A ['Osedax' symbiont bacterium Rs2_46_30_T18]